MNHPTPDESLTKLLRLKAQEQPPEGYAEEVLTRVQLRQREDLLQRSARGLLWERVGTFLDSLGRRRVVYALALLYLAVVVGLWTGLTRFPVSAPGAGAQPVHLETVTPPTPPAEEEGVPGTKEL
ncbi:MAG: hypothetical protein AAF555_09120 [Verrucomicrobiota bacterium]